MIEESIYRLTLFLEGYYGSLVALSTRYKNNVLYRLNSDLYWFYFTSIIVVFVYFLFKGRSPRFVINRFYRYLKRARFRTELLKDIYYFPVHTLITALVIFTIGYNIGAIFDFYRGILNPTNSTWIVFNGHVMGFVRIFFIVMIIDFAEFVMHLVHHKFDNLWRFHKMHHRCTSLNSLTKYRIHPVEAYVNVMVRALVSAPLLILLNLSFSANSSNSRDFWYRFVIIGLTYFVLSHLRHSSVRIHYPKFLSYILISPVMHQVHHSNLREHMGKNFGVVFSFWDYLNGSLYIPKQDEYFKFGLKEDGNNVITLREEMWRPFAEVFLKYRFKISQLFRNK